MVRGVESARLRASRDLLRLVLTPVIDKKCRLGGFCVVSGELRLVVTREKPLHVTLPIKREVAVTAGCGASPETRTKPARAVDNRDNGRVSAVGGGREVRLYASATKVSTSCGHALVLPGFRKYEYIQ